MEVHEMSKQDCIEMLSRATIGRLACTHNNQPYIVPIYFVFEGSSLYGFTTRGQKIDWMRSNPLVCIEIDEVENSLHWMSVLVFGRYEELDDSAENQYQSLRAHAHDLLQNRRGFWWEPGCASSLLRHSKETFAPIYYRICIDHITGRKATSDF